MTFDRVDLFIQACLVMRFTELQLRFRFVLHEKNTNRFMHLSHKDTSLRTNTLPERLFASERGPIQLRKGLKSGQGSVLFRRRAECRQGTHANAVTDRRRKRLRSFSFSLCGFNSEVLGRSWKRSFNRSLREGFSLERERWREVERRRMGSDCR